MFKDRDFEIMMESEVFREFLKVSNANELESLEADRLREIEEDEREAEDLDSALEEFNAFDSNLSPEMRRAFVEIRDKFINEPELMEMVDSNLVRAVFMLSLDDSSDDMIEEDV